MSYRIYELTEEYVGRLAKILCYFQVCVDDSLVRQLGGSIDPRAVSAMTATYTTEPDKVIFIAEQDDEVVGIFWGEWKFYPFTYIKTAFECYFSVHTDHRGRGIGQKLVREFELWAIEKGCKIISCDVNNFSSGGSDKAKDRLRKDGYLDFGSQFMKRI
jgi:GNAT superfamily N-acetyltransferase